MRRPGDITQMAALEPERAREQGAVVRRLVGYLRPHVRTIAAAGGFIVIVALAQGVGPYLVSRAIDRDIAARDGRALAVTMALLLCVYAAGSVASRAQTRRVGQVAQHVLAELRERLFRHLTSLPLQYFDKHPVGDLMSRVQSDVDTLNQFFSQGLMQLLGSLFGLAGIITAMLVLDARLALACFSIIPAMLLITWAFATRARKAYRRTRETVGDVTANLQEEIVGVRQSQAFNRTELNIERFRNRNAANRDANVAATGITSAFSPVIEILSTLGTALVIGYGGFRVLAGELSVGLVAAFLIYVQQFFRPVQLAAATYTLMQSAFAGAERIFEILDHSPEAPDAKDAVVLERAEGRLELENVGFAYEPERPVLHQVSFAVEPGQTIALVGRTGAGKTTVASLIPRLYDATSGEVRIDGHDVRTLARASLRSQISVVPQEAFLFSATIAQNIAYGRPDATVEQIERAARAVHAHDFITALPSGYETVLGEGGATVSHGQRQLLAFARAVLVDPRILILDEATAHIDTRTEALIQKALAQLLSGRTSVVIAHRLSTIRSANRIIVLEQGRVAEQGTHEELMARRGVYADLYQRQFASAPTQERAAV